MARFQLLPVKLERLYHPAVCADQVLANFPLLAVSVLKSRLRIAAVIEFLRRENVNNSENAFKTTGGFRASEVSYIYVGSFLLRRRAREGEGRVLHEQWSNEASVFRVTRAPEVRTPSAYGPECVCSFTA